MEIRQTEKPGFDISAISTNTKFRVICIGCAAMHLTFLIEFLIFGCYLMMSFNIVSVSIYIFCAVKCLRGTIIRHAKRWISIIFGEITIHAVLCIVMMGMEPNFQLYLLLTVPILAYVMFFFLDRKSFVKFTIAFSVLTVFAAAACIVFTNIYESVYAITGMRVLKESEIELMRSINLIACTSSIIAFIAMFCGENFALMTKLSRKNEELEYTATHDALTGLSTRHTLWKFFSALEGEYCVIMGDIDDFKKVNDTYGHDCGDLVLKSVAQIILSSVKEDELAVRWGGEEMLMVMRGGKDECLKRADLIKKKINELALVHEQKNVKVSMTFGFVESSELVSDDLHSHASMDLLISIADKRLYVGKRSGKNVIVAA